MYRYVDGTDQQSIIKWGFIMEAKHSSIISSRHSAKWMEVILRSFNHKLPLIRKNKGNVIGSWKSESGLIWKPSHLLIWQRCCWTSSLTLPRRIHWTSPMPSYLSERSDYWMDCKPDLRSSRATSKLSAWVSDDHWKGQYPRRMKTVSEVLPDVMVSESAPFYTHSRISNKHAPWKDNPIHDRLRTQQWNIWGQQYTHWCPYPVCTLEEFPNSRFMKAAHLQLWHF